MTAAKKKVASLPLFPLGQPTFPGVYTRLRIFEQRYLSLVRESVRNQAPFGIVPILQGSEVLKNCDPQLTPSYHPWGTEVRIVDWEQYQDGILGITVIGEQRFEVLTNKLQADGLIVANIRPQPLDEAEEPDIAHEDMLQLLSDLAAGLRIKKLFPDTPLTVSSLGWRLATLLPLPDHCKFDLLAEGDPEQRLDLIRAGLAQLMERNGE